MSIQRPSYDWKFEVDAVNDGPGQGYWMSRGTLQEPPSPPNSDGIAFVLGLFDKQPTQVAPTLRAYGEPASEHDVLFHVDRLPDNTTLATLNFGGPGYGLIIGGCEVLTDGLIGSETLTENAGAAYHLLELPITTSLLYFDLYYQVAAYHPQGQGLVLSNGLRLKFGGSL